MTTQPSVSATAPSRLPVLVLPLMALGAIVGASLSEAAANDAAADGWRWLYWVCKPLATLLILLLAWRVMAPVSAVYRRRILLGTMLSLVGDVFLMLSARWFVAGLLSFLLAHLCFIAAFVSDKPMMARPLPWLLCLLYGAFAVWLLWPALAPLLRVAVPLYIAVLATMAGQALGRVSWLAARNDPRAGSARLAAIGALVFMLSDSLLAWNRFMASLPWSSVWVLGTYYVALWLIARSVDAQAAPMTNEQVRR